MESEALIQAIVTLEPASQKKDEVALPAVGVPPDRVAPLLARLRDDTALAFDLLLTHTAVDRLEGGVFELLYVLTSTVHGHTLVVATSIPRENPVAASVSAIYRIAHWHEREVYDMFGVLYQGHADLRRLFLEDNWQGFPLRRDYADPFMLPRPE